MPRLLMAYLLFGGIGGVIGGFVAPVSWTVPGSIVGGGLSLALLGLLRTLAPAIARRSRSA